MEEDEAMKGNLEFHNKTAEMSQEVGEHNRPDKMQKMCLHNKNQPILCRSYESTPPTPNEMPEL